MPITGTMGTPAKALFDEAGVSRVFDHDAGSILELIGLVISDLPRYASALLAHVDRCEWSDAGRIAHTIKGAAGNVFATHVTTLAHAIEQSVRDGRIDSLRNDARALDRAVIALVRALEQWSRRLRVEPEIA